MFVAIEDLKLLDKPCSLKNVLRCPYHSWSYDFEGKLVATPHIGGLNIHESEKFDKSKSNLKEVKNKSLDGYNIC
jgi:choline monooxygenase